MSQHEDADFSKNATIQMDESTPINILNDPRLQALKGTKPLIGLKNLNNDEVTTPAEPDSSQLN